MTCRQVGPALPGTDVGDVADIATVHLGARPEVALNEVAGRLGVGIGPGGLAPALLAPSLEAGLTHQPGHLALAAGVAMEELLVDPRGAIGSLGLGVDALDLLEQLGVGDLFFARKRCFGAGSRRTWRPRADHTPWRRCDLRLSPPR
jgi:hypothetical protein